jgi:transketolase
MSATEADKLKTLENNAVNTIRCLAMDAVQAAKSGHPGTPMAMAPVAYQLWNRHLRFDPNDPIWPNRDRFVLSMGHASMLLYSMLHLTQVKAVNSKYECVGEVSVKLDDIKKFRQLDSKCPGHPEYRWTSGVETTTGPLGQGFATSVGMAAAGKWLGGYFNKPGFEMFNFRVYALGGDGCMMEGAASEAASLAGHLKLDNLCWIYDNNKISIEGNTDWSFSEDVATRFIAYGWNVTRVGDANDLAMLKRAFDNAKGTPGRPTLIIVDSHIAYGAPTLEGSHKAHGAPLGDPEIEGAKAFYGFPPKEKFYVPEGVYDCFKQGIGQRGAQLRGVWMTQYEEYKTKYPDLAAQMIQIQKRELPADWEKALPVYPPDAKGKAGRQCSSEVLNALAKPIPWLIGGSADLAPSTLTRLGQPSEKEGNPFGDFGPDGHFVNEHGPKPLTWAGRNFHFGVRELAMGACLNGMALTKVRPYGSGFFVFSDFSRPTIRLASLMEIPVIYIFTHDSIGVGEDGPTHQPIEHMASLRAIPGLITMRPGDANEVAEAWRHIIGLRHHPVVLVLSRQEMPTLDRTKYAAASGVHKGAYVLGCNAPDGKPEVILMGTGTELGLCVSAYEKLKAEGVKARVVSMPSWELFEEQDQSYRDSVLPPASTARVSVEAAGTFGWHKYVGEHGATIGVKTFGASAPLAELSKKFGFSTEAVVAAAKAQMARVKGNK